MKRPIAPSCPLCGSVMSVDPMRDGWECDREHVDWGDRSGTFVGSDGWVAPPDGYAEWQLADGSRYWIEHSGVRRFLPRVELEIER